MKRFTRKMLVLAFTAAWAVAPAFPSMVCALTLPSIDRSVLAEKPDCHQASATAGAAGESATHRACCADAATSCCLEALDVEGAVGGLLMLDVSAASVEVFTLPHPASLSPSLPLFGAETRAHSPPENLFRVLRL
jgi:hypothetical protein